MKKVISKKTQSKFEKVVRFIKSRNPRAKVDIDDAWQYKINEFIVECTVRNKEQGKSTDYVYHIGCYDGDFDRLFIKNEWAEVTISVSPNRDLVFLVNAEGEIVSKICDTKIAYSEGCITNSYVEPKEHQSLEEFVQEKCNE